MKSRVLFLSALLIPLLTACKQQEQATVAGDTDGVAPSTASITGTVAYRERIALSPEAVVEVSLLDVSRQDVEATVIARQTIANPGQVPVNFELEYDTQDIDEHMSYAISARISEGGDLRFVSDTHTPVLTRGAGRHVDMVLIGVRKPGFGLNIKPAMNKPAPEEGSGGMDLEGMFHYMADAAIFRDCRNNKTYPVSMEGAYMELERAYLNSDVEAGSEVMVRLKGRLLERPAMEGNTNKVKLIVDKVMELLPEKTCTASVHAELLGTYWKLLELGGEPVVTPEGRKEAHIILAGADSRAHGNAGCNNFFGQFQAGDDSLSFSAMGSTMMACPEGMDTEQAFLGALGETTRYEISGLFLELFADNRLLARLEAIYL